MVNQTLNLQLPQNLFFRYKFNFYVVKNGERSQVQILMAVFAYDYHASKILWELWWTIFGLAMCEKQKVSIQAKEIIKFIANKIKSFLFLGVGQRCALLGFCGIAPVRETLVILLMIQGMFEYPV